MVPRRSVACRPLATLAVVIVAVLAGCSGNRCLHTDWCACSGGAACFQSCDDTNGCRFFCDHMEQCAATCGSGCSFNFHDAQENSFSCGDECHIICTDSTACGAFCGSGCDYTAGNADRSGVRAGPNSRISCVNVKSCVVECLGQCTVFCMDQVDACDVQCPGGAPPLSCDSGAIACGSC